MSWITRIEGVLTIITGDGKEWTPLWKPSVRQVEYNVAKFEFPNLAGTLVKRGTPMGMAYEVVIWFEGENHIETTNSFLESAADKRPFTIIHPLYDRLIVQPLGFNIDESSHNVSKLTGTVVETIINDKPQILVSPIDKIRADKENLDASFVNGFNVTPSAKDVNTLSTNNATLYAKGSKLTKLQEESEAYFNIFKTANAAIVNATQEPLTAMRMVQSMINAPALFASSVKSRIDLLTSQFSLLSQSVTGSADYASKKIFEFNGGGLVSAMAFASTQPLDKDYSSRSKVYQVVGQLVNAYNAYKSKLDLLQSYNGGSVGAFIPDADSLISLNLLMNFTVSNLFSIALNSKQERSFYLENDTNLIILAHRLYGLKEDDSTIDTLIETNNIGLNEMLLLKKGRKIVYYV